MPQLVIKNALRIVSALGAFFVVALVLVACGGGSDSLSGNDVAAIDGASPVTKSDYQHWADITAKGAAGPTGAAVAPDPPNYTKCIAGLRAATKVKKGQPKPSDTTLRAQCKQRNQQVIDQTMATLIQSNWIEAEAKQQGVTVSDKDIDKQLAKTKKQSFPTAKAYNKFLAQSGMSNDDVRFRLRIQLLAQKLTAKIQNSAAPVTSAQISAYYAKNKAQFALPERRDLQIILTKTQAQANTARAAVMGGMSWAAATKKYSTDAASKASGGVLRGVAKGQQDKALDTEAFGAKKGVLSQPVKGQFGWYIVRVTNITPPKQTSLKDATAQIKPVLTQQGQQQKLQTFAASFQKRWLKATKCRAGYVVTLCSNAPKPKTTTAGGTVATTPSTSGK